MPEGLYVQDGRVIVTHSMLKTFRRCPKQAQFKYYERLKPRLLGQPLKRGTWIHRLLEEHHAGRDWRVVHKKLSAQFARLFDEEREYYGDMPTEIGHIMRSYEWHYKFDPWKVLETEYQIEAELPGGEIYRGKVDAIIENQFGIWIVDHKSHKTLPDFNFRLLDAQSSLYLWAAQAAGIPAKGFIWNYIRWKAPTIPELVYKDTKKPRLSKKVADTDFPTYVRAIQGYKRDYPHYTVSTDERERAAYLKRLRYNPAQPGLQQSTFFRRDILEKDARMLSRVAIENYHTALRMNEYNFAENEAVERVVDRSCSFSCSYVDLCAADLMGGNIELIKRQNFTVGDPNDYYNDRAGEDPNKEERA